jgi:hypothetical protein
MNRPISAVILTVLAVLAGILAVLDVLRYLGILPIASLGEVKFFGASILGAIFAAMVAAIWFWAAQKLWNLDPQGWQFVVLVCIFYLAFDLVAIISGTPVQAMIGSIVVTVLALIIALLPGTKAAYQQS